MKLPVFRKLQYDIFQQKGMQFYVIFLVLYVWWSVEHAFSAPARMPRSVVLVHLYSCHFVPGTRNLSWWCESSTGTWSNCFPQFRWCFHPWNPKCNLSLAWSGMFTVLHMFHVSFSCLPYVYSLNIIKLDVWHINEFTTKKLHNKWHLSTCRRILQHVLTIWLLLSSTNSQNIWR